MAVYTQDSHPYSQRPEPVLLSLWKTIGLSWPTPAHLQGSPLHQKSTIEDVLSAAAEEVQPAKDFYTAIIESILTSSITIRYTAATAKDKGRLQCVIRAAERMIGCNLPSLEDLHTFRSLRRARKIVADPSHPGHTHWSSHSPPAGGCSPIGPKPHAMWTVSFMKSICHFIACCTTFPVILLSFLFNILFYILYITLYRIVITLTLYII